MLPRRTTILILADGRTALSLELPGPVARARWLTAALFVPLMTGIAAQRSFGMTSELPGLALGSLNRITGHAPLVAGPAPAPAHAMVAATPSYARTLTTSVRPVEPPPSAARFAPLRAAGIRDPRATLAAFEGPTVISVKAILKELSLRRKASTVVEPNAVPINGVLRIAALHLEETLSVRPFDDLLRPDPRAFADVNHLMRCRVTGHQTDMDPRLVGILSQLSTLYGRTLQLISGHRAPHANGTSPTSQHTLGRAADIRVPGVPIAELKKAAIKLGARGVGLYPEKGFVHVDVRDKQRYFWTWTARGGEQADMGTTAPPRAAKTAGIEPSPEPHDEGGEASDMGATSPDTELSAQVAEAPEKPAADVQVEVEAPEVEPEPRAELGPNDAQ